MVRKQTWILLAVFAVLLAGMFYLQKNPLPSSGSTTPSPTSAAPVLQGWTSSDIVSMEFKDTHQGTTIQISQDAQGNWTLGPDKKKVDTGLAEELRTQIAEFRPIAALPTGLQLQAIGLETPSRILSIRNKQGKQSELRIGNADPTDSGYYVQMDNQPPVVIAKSTIDGTLDLFNNAIPTPTAPPVTPTAAATSKPQATATP